MIKRDKHIDLMPIFQKKFNTSIVKEASFDDLSAVQCKELVQMCSIRPFSTKAENVKMLGAVDYNHVGIVENYMKANTEVKIVKKIRSQALLLHDIWRRSRDDWRRCA